MEFEPVWIDQIFLEDDFVGSEIRSHGALSGLSDLMDLPLTFWEPEIKRGDARAFILARKNAPLRTSIAVQVKKKSRGHVVVCAFHPSMERVDPQNELLLTLIDVLNRKIS